jgi:hypothetical protein
VIGLNYIAYAFATDFLGNSNSSGMKFLFGYLPFNVLSIAGPLLRAVVYVKHANQTLKGIRTS